MTDSQRRRRRLELLQELNRIEALQGHPMTPMSVSDPSDQVDAVIRDVLEVVRKHDGLNLTRADIIVWLADVAIAVATGDASGNPSIDTYTYSTNDPALQRIIDLLCKVIEATHGLPSSFNDGRPDGGESVPANPTVDEPGATRH